MSIVRGMRVVNSIEAGITDGTALEALLADAGRRAEFAAVVGMKGQARRMADGAATVSAIAASAYAVGLVMGNAVASAEFGSNIVSQPILRGSRTAMKAATLGEPGMRQFASKFPWTARTSNVASQLRAFAYGNGMWVGVGEGGVIATSTDGLAWTARPSVTIGATGIVDIAFAAGVFVVIAGATSVYTSPDAVTWTARTVTGAGTLSRVKAINGMCVIVGLNGSTNPAVWYQADPATAWSTTTQIVGGGLNYLMLDIEYGNGVWVAVGRDASTGSVGYYSSSLSGGWVAGTAPFNSRIARTLAFGNGVFMAASNYGAFVTSTNGSTWTSATALADTINTVPTGAHMLFSNGVFFVPVASVGGSWTNHGVICSKDSGLTWSLSFAAPSTCFTVNSGNGLLLTGAGAGPIYTNY